MIEAHVDDTPALQHVPPYLSDGALLGRRVKGVKLDFLILGALTRVEYLEMGAQMTWFDMMIDFGPV